MGAGQSARKLTISNEDELGVIHISSGVAQRLAHGIGNANKEAPSAVTGGDSNANIGRSLESTSNSEKHEGAQPTSHHNTANQTAANQTAAYPPVHVHPQYTMSALKMEQQKEAELRNQDLYWRKRLENVKENHAKIDHILQSEYQRAIDEVTSHQGKKKVDVSSVVPPCIENKDKVLRCYQENPKEILKCSSLVEEFSNCVDQRRGRLIDARC